MEHPNPKRLQDPATPQYEEDYEEVEDEEALEEMPQERNLKKKEAPTELTEEMVIKALENLSYRVGRIEHHLRLDY
jgi:hypothetical protein